MERPIKELRFSVNWNNKLYCNIFATLRFDLNGLIEDDTVNILLRKKGAYISTGMATIIRIFENVEFSMIKWYLPIDTGYSLEESLKLFSNYQLAFFTPGISPNDAISLKVILLTPNCLI